MDYTPELTRGTLIKRYKRFLADITLDTGEEITAHCANTGSMKTCGEPGDQVWLSKSDNPKRKLQWSWECTQTTKGLIGINTARPNHLVVEAIKNGTIKELQPYETLKTEVKYGEKSRIDILLEHGPDAKWPKTWVEVKNTTLLQSPTVVAFPDAVTARGLKHIIELEKQVLAGDRGVLFFLVNRPEGEVFRPAWDIDPKWCEALIKARKTGVEVLAYRAVHTTTNARVTEPVPIDWSLSTEKNSASSR